ncbi:type II toxin-antitoxin system PemK/MazF family toxin [Nocardia sp. NPDC048505]|uniref:type II toxin-antitoxin system PemK/MazF family toxin n=1 Tax=Nocardia sp. NPDC048505 TaxID=3155756 RepID=UPI00341123CD
MTERIEPWQVWWVDLEPIAGREQGRTRPAIVVSSAFHLRLMQRELITIVPLTSVDRPSWRHRVPIDAGAKARGWAITEQIRTISARRFTGNRPIGAVPAKQAAELRSVLARMTAFS